MLKLIRDLSIRGMLKLNKYIFNTFAFMIYQNAINRAKKMLTINHYV